jgi:RES domain-containing protein
MPTAFRIFKSEHAAAAFTGEGARLYGGRWNSRGTAVVYTASSCALAALEMLVHLDDQQLLESYLVAEIEFDGRLARTLAADELPSDWRADPAPAELQALGDAWIVAGTSAVLRVPSSVIDTESNFLLNPAHGDFAKIVVAEGRPFTFDPRLR